MRGTRPTATHTLHDRLGTVSVLDGQRGIGVRVGDRSSPTRSGSSAAASRPGRSALKTGASSRIDTVAVLGCGGVGRRLIQGARIAGAAAHRDDRTALKRKMAKQSARPTSYDPSAGDASSSVKLSRGPRRRLRLEGSASRSVGPP